MTVIEPTKRDAAHPGKIKRYSPSLRLWHWANALVITGSLLTVLLNATILDDRGSADVIKSNLQKAGTAVTGDAVRSTAHALSDKVWDIHVYFGYGLAGLLLFRILLEFFQLADQRFIRLLKKAYLNFRNDKKDREKAATHDFVVKSIYLVFYFLLIIMVITGLFLAFEDFFAPYKAIRHAVKNFHGFVMYLVLAFIGVHLAGVFLAERKNSKGIVSDMINGGGE